MPIISRKVIRSCASAALLVLVATGLSGCFDLSQNVAIGRDGSGSYGTSISAGGIVGEALRDKRSNTDLVGDNRAVTTTRELNGVVTQTSIAEFKSLSDLRFDDQSLSVTVRGHSLMGTNLTFRRAFHVDRARAEHAPDQDEMGPMGRSIAQSILGDHSYVFSVTLPGSIDRITPIVIAGQTITPQVTGDYFHHTVTWRMPLYLMVAAHALVFEVDFSAYGWFDNAQTRRG